MGPGLPGAGGQEKEGRAGMSFAAGDWSAWLDPQGSPGARLRRLGLAGGLQHPTSW